jgi:Flp pilus assembly protein TadD
MRTARRDRPSGARRGGSSDPRPASLQIWLIAIALAAAAGWAYSTSFAGVFIFDDKPSIVDNPNIRTLWPLTTALSAPREVAVSARPVASLTLAINYALAPADVRDVMAPGGAGAPEGTADRFLRNVWGYHFVNLALLVLTALALFGVVRRTLLTAPLAPRFGRASTALAFAVTLVWIVHPLLTDAVTYVIQRIELLMGLFYLLTLYCAIRAWSSGQGGLTPAPPSDSAWLWTALAIVSCALGMASKQVMISAPIMVWLWDWTFGGDRARRRRLYGGLAATWIILAALVVYERWPHSIGLDREGWTPWTYLLTETGVIVHYVRLAVVPSPLVIDYDGWPMARSILTVAPQATLLTTLVVLTMLAAVRRRPWAFASLWCFAILAPSSSVLPLATEVAAERRMYLPLAGLVAVGVIGAYAIGQRALAARVADPRLRRRVGVGAAVVLTGSLAVTFAAMTYARNRDFSSDERIWQDAVVKRPTNSRARVNYGSDLSAAHRFPEAERQLAEAVRLKDTSASAHLNLGVALCSLDRIDEGIAHLERALALDPGYIEAMSNLGEAYAAEGRRGAAARYFTMAVGARPDDPFLLNRLGWLLATSPEDEVRNGANAVTLAERAVRVTARADVTSLDTLGAAYAEVDRFSDAVVAAREALALANRIGERAIVPEIEGRLALYTARQKFREAKRSPLSLREQTRVPG